MFGKDHLRNFKDNDIFFLIVGFWRGFVILSVNFLENYFLSSDSWMYVGRRNFFALVYFS